MAVLLLFSFVLLCVALASKVPPPILQQQRQQRQPASLKSPLFVGTLDGSLFALSRESGKALWTLNGGPLLSGSTSEGHEQEPMFLPDPRDGSLYVASADLQGLRRVDQTIHDLVHDAPFTADDGNVYLGSKTTRVYALDMSTGALVSKYLPDRDEMGDDAAPELQAGDDSQSIVIGRTEYTVTVRNRMSSQMRWNITLAEYSHPLASLTAAQFADMHPDFGSINIVTSANGQHVLSFFANGQDSVQGNRWSAHFNSPVVALYCASNRGSLHKLPLTAGVDENFDVSTVLSRQEDVATSPLAPTPDVASSWALLRVAKTAEGLLYAAATVLSPDVHSGFELEQYSLAVVPFSPQKSPGVSAVSVPWELTRPNLIASDRHGEVVPLSLPSHVAHFPESLIGDHVILRPVAQSTYEVQVKNGHLIDSTAKLVSSSASASTTLISLLGGAVFATVVALIYAYRTLYRASALAQHETVRLSEALLAAHAEVQEANAERAAAVSAELAAAADAVAMAASRSFPLSVGKLTVQDTVLGHGSLGTIIYQGLYEGQAVAVKRMLSEYFDVARHEVDLLRQSDDHPNVVRYFVTEQDHEFFYIGLELCLATLVQVVEGPTVSTRGTHHGALLDFAYIQKLDRVTLARDFLSGIAHLHALNIVHRDIKPQNILLSSKFRAMISDFGLCKALSQDEHSFKSGSVGTHGWTAPEVLTHQRTTKAVDAFSAGCVLHYLMYAAHPFGPYYEREANIRRGRQRGPRELPLVDGLVLQLLRPDYLQRPTVTAALAHPFFWDKAKRLSFLMDVSDRVEKETGDAPLVVALQALSAAVFGADWTVALTADLVADLGKFRKYKSHAMIDLLRAIRNKKHHFQELPEGLKASLGAVPDGFADYFAVRFPLLLVRVFDVVADSPAKHERLFSPYFC